MSTSTRFPVQDLDYAALVKKMIAAGIPKFFSVVSEELAKIPRPVWRNEVRYFWLALANETHQQKADAIWLWLLSTGFLSELSRAGKVPDSVLQELAGSAVELPEIGGPDDELVSKVLKEVLYSAEPTVENFMEQAAALDAALREQGEQNPQNRCKTIGEYVATWYHSGTGKMTAQIQLAREGYSALATPEGMDWLMSTYQPKDAMVANV